MASNNSVSKIFRGNCLCIELCVKSVNKQTKHAFSIKAVHIHHASVEGSGNTPCMYGRCLHHYGILRPPSKENPIITITQMKKPRLKQPVPGFSRWGTAVLTWQSQYAGLTIPTDGLRKITLCLLRHPHTHLHNHGQQWDFADRLTWWFWDMGIKSWTPGEPSERRPHHQIVEDAGIIDSLEFHKDHDFLYL